MTLPDKPKYGLPCNGCGRCCAEELCEAAEVAFPGAQAPCPALKLSPDRTRTYCQLVAIEIMHNLEPVLQKSLGIGQGCSMHDESVHLLRYQDAISRPLDTPGS